MEQTSSAAYPNILVVDYVKKARVANPKLLMKAENYLNVGYQKLLTFERPGGGFDWWGSGEPLVWLSAYGLQEFNDMSKVYPIDRGVIDRTQAWLMKQREPDGTWSKIGAANALAAWDANDDSTLEVLKKLAAMKKELPEQKALCFPVKEGQSLSYSRG